MAVRHKCFGFLAAGDGPATDRVDTGLDLVRGRLREWRAAAGTAEFGVDDAVRLAGAVTPGADEAVEFLAHGGEDLAAHGGCLRGLCGGRGGSGGGGGGSLGTGRDLGGLA